MNGTTATTRDRHVLALQVRGGALLHGARDLLHALVAGRLLEDPRGQPEPVPDSNTGADEGDEYRMVHEPVHSVAPSRDSQRRGFGARPRFYSDALTASA